MALTTTSLIGALFFDLQDKLAIDKCNGNDCEDQDDDFELQKCPKNVQQKYEGYLKRGYNLIGYETETIQDTKFLKFLRFKTKPFKWDDQKKDIPHQVAYPDKTCIENLSRKAMPSTWNESKYDTTQPRFGNENLKRRSRTRAKPSEDFDEYKYGLLTREDSEESEDHFQVKKISFFQNSNFWPTEQSKNIEDTGELGGVKYYFEKLGINVGEGREGDSSDGINSDVQIHVRMKDLFKEFSSKNITTYVTPGGQSLSGGEEELLPLKNEGAGAKLSLVEINGVTIKTNLPVRFKGKAENWVIKGGPLAVAGDSKPGHAPRFTSKQDDDDLKICTEGFNQAKGRTLISNLDDCDYCGNKQTTSLGDAIKVSEYKRT